MSDQRYLKPTTMDTFFNRVMGLLTNLGISVMGSRVLAVKGRKSGQWRTTPVNLLVLGGARYLVAPRGQTQWVHNIRAAGGGELRLGRKAEPFTVTELADADKPPIIRAYLTRWGWEVGRFFDGLTKDAGDEEIAAVAPGFPVFRIN
jgi:deazaflavin-dependent oxidoreductase (nitroreductase family)